MRITASAIARAECTMVAGYVPPKTGGEFSHVVVLTGSGTFSVPEEVLSADSPRIRFVLIGGGSGGYSGEKGEDGSEGIYSSPSNCAKPGRPGKNGDPGRILSVQYDGDNVHEAYWYYCGAGGHSGYDSVGMEPGEGMYTALYWPEKGRTIAESANPYSFTDSVAAYTVFTFDCSLETFLTHIKSVRIEKVV